MASNSHRKSASSASRKASAPRRSPSAPARSGGSGRGVRMPQTNPRRKQGAASPAPRGRGQQQAGYNPRARSYGSTPTPVRSVRVGDMGFNSGHARAQASYRRYLRRLAIIALMVAVVVGGGVALYTSSLFPITNVSVQGV
ncbi:MAG: cell division protein FtsQ, partial [Raoultibacter sp.]